MTYKPAGGVTSWTDRVAAIPNWAALAAVFVAIVIGVHGVGHVLLAPAGHLHVSMQSVLLVLWVLTTLVALGGLAVLGGAYTSVVHHLNTGPQTDLEILPEDEQCILEQILETPAAPGLASTITGVRTSGRRSFTMVDCTRQ